MTAPETRTLDVPGVALHYEVRPNESSTAPTLLMIGSPMGASGFAPLAEHFKDRTVVTYDPRGVEASTRTDDADESTPEQHADDLHRIIDALDSGPVEIFASSGGAINALALVAAHPEQVSTLLAHEPPAAALVEDSEAALAACKDVHETYLAHGFGAGMAKFIGLVVHHGPITADYADQPAPDPGMFGLPADDDGTRNDALLQQNIVSCTHYRPDFDALRSASTRIVVAAGKDSEGQLANRGGHAVADRLGTPPVAFPGDHGGFLPPEMGGTGNVEDFAAAVRGVLDHD
jgi:pimeloyl-ACP methyl ester carboxylesterase